MDRSDDHRLVAYVYGELSGDDARRVKDALEADPSLRTEVEALASIQRLFAMLDEPEPPPRVRSRVFAHACEAAEQLRTEAGLGGFYRLWRRMLSPGPVRVTAMVVAGLAALIVVPMVLMRPGDRVVVPHDPQIEPSVGVVGALRAPGRSAATEHAWALREAPGSPRKAKTRLGGQTVERPGGVRAPVGKLSMKAFGRGAAGGFPDPASSVPPVAGMALPARRAEERAAAVPSGSTEALPVGLFEDEASARARAPGSEAVARRGEGVLAMRLLRLAESKIARGDREAARGILRHAVARTQGSPRQGEVWLRWAHLEFEDNRLDRAEVYAGRALEVKGFQGQDRVRALLSKLSEVSERRKSRTRPPTD